MYVYGVIVLNCSMADGLGGPRFDNWFGRTNCVLGALSFVHSAISICWNGLVRSLRALSKYSICVLVVAINTHELIRSINWLPVVVVQVLVVV